jgi:biopolymer transport protein ExbB/TolQ
MEFAVRFYEAIRSNQISEFFALVILAVLGFSLIARLFPQSRRLEFIESAAPTTMTTLGVLGTFAGIYLGLLDFNVSNIDASVPMLLEGLKIAFSTSIVGMGSAILLRLFQTALPRPDAGAWTACCPVCQFWYAR